MVSLSLQIVDSRLFVLVVSVALEFTLLYSQFVTVRLVPDRPEGGSPVLVQLLLSLEWVLRRLRLVWLRGLLWLIWLGSQVPLV